MPQKKSRPTRPTRQKNKELVKFKADLREAIGNYMRSEGCSCCQNVEDHKKHAAVLGKLLGVKKYPDGSGYAFFNYSTKSKAERKKNGRLK